MAKLTTDPKDLLGKSRQLSERAHKEFETGQYAEGSLSLLAAARCRRLLGRAVYPGLELSLEAGPQLAGQLGMS